MNPQQQAALQNMNRLSRQEMAMEQAQLDWSRDKIENVAWLFQDGIRPAFLAQYQSTKSQWELDYDAAMAELNDPNWLEKEFERLAALDDQSPTK